MYFIELLVKKFTHKNKTEEEYNPLEEEKHDTDYEKCEHVFMPIDSTGETLACRNCGMVIKRNELNDINFFRKH